MKTSTRILIVAFILLLIPQLTSAVDRNDRPPVYVGVDTLPPQLLSPPPEEGDAAWQRDIEGVREAQKEISPSDLAALRNEQHLRLESITSALGSDFTAARFPKTFTLLDDVFRDTGRITENDKQFWHTRRPYLTDHLVKLLVDPIDASPSFPSGHTCESRVIAEVLGMLFPGKRDLLRARAAAIARHRIEAGVHYPTDIRGGEALAMLVTGALMENETFRSDLAAAREEIATGG